jgi:hypothetical protein
VYVQQQQVEVAPLQGVQRLAAGAGDCHLVPAAGEEVPDHLLIQLVVFGHQHAQAAPGGRRDGAARAL